MIEIGYYHELKIKRDTSVGLFLEDEDGEQVLLPNKYVPEDLDREEPIEVFIYLDAEERPIATTLEPKIFMNEFAFLRAKSVADVGAFMDWGLEKDLFVPYREQLQNIEENRSYVVYLDLDEETDRLYASNRVERFLQNEEITVEKNEEVEILVYKETEIGYSVIINHEHKGLLFKNEIFQPIKIGDSMQAYIKNVRDDKKIDVSLQPSGYKLAANKNSELLWEALQKNDGYLPLTDKSSPEMIYSKLKISKKSFKRAVGDLFKKRKITLHPKGIKIVESV